jgi:anti-sigma regulatory factor (Ser/Thr protein kinase)
MASPDLGRATAGGQQPAPDGAVPVPPDDVPLDQRFDSDGLFSLRAAVSAHASDLGLGPERVGDVVMIAHELASNVIRHGGTAGRLRLWRTDHAVLCQVSDTGPGLADPAAAGRAPAPLSAPDGRGLWIVRQLSDRLDIESGPDGSILTVTIAIAGPND